MTDIHVITSSNRHIYEDAIEQHHRIRHDIFVEERGWSALYRPDKREIDAFDTEHAVYLLAIDNSRVVGGQRLCPTIRPHMLSEVFPHLAQRGVPRGPDILEWTRYFIVRERRFGRTDWRLLAAVQEYCLEEGVVALTAVVEMWWLPRWQQAGFRIRPLGLPQKIEGEETHAAMLTVSSETLQFIRHRAGLKNSALVRHGPELPIRHQQLA